MRDPEGHSYNQAPEKLAAFELEQWHTCETYLYGIDLFNHGYWWEAHEALEAVWVAAGRQTETGLFIQGLIQIAVAHLKRYQRFHDVALRLSQDGLEKMRRIHGVYLGIDTQRLREDVTHYFAGKVNNPVSIELQTDSNN